MNKQQITNIFNAIVNRPPTELERARMINIATQLDIRASDPLFLLIVALDIYYRAVADSAQHAVFQQDKDDFVAAALTAASVSSYFFRKDSKQVSSRNQNQKNYATTIRL